MNRILLFALLVLLALGTGRADEEAEPVATPTPSEEDHAGERFARALARLEANVEKMKRHVPAIIEPTPTPDLRPFAVRTMPPEARGD